MMLRHKRKPNLLSKEQEEVAILIVYDSKTGNVNRFVNKLGLDHVKVRPGLIVHEPFILITYTTGFGEVPETTLEFLESNHHLMVAVASSGNRVWGDKFANAANIISERYSVPILLKFELSGTTKDVEKFLQEASNLGKQVDTVKQ